MHVYASAENEQTILEIVVDEDPGSSREWDNLGTIVCFHSRYNLGDEQLKYREEWLAGLVSDLYEHEYPDEYSEDEWDEFIEYVEDGIEEYVKKAWELLYEKAIIMDIYLYDHSSITISTTPFSCPWDSGKVGYIYVLKSKVFEECTLIGLLHGINNEYVEWGPHGNHVIKQEGEELFEKLKEAFKKKEWIPEMAKGVGGYLNGEVETYDQYLRGDIYGFILSKKCSDCGEKGDSIDSVWGFYGDDYDKNGMRDHLEEKYQGLFDEL